MEAYYAAIITVLAVFGLVLKMTTDMKKHCEEHATDCEEHRSTLYRRFDEYKKHMEGTHVSEKVCGILHEQLNKDVAEIKSDVKELLRKANGKE